MSDRDGDIEIYIARPDGTKVQRLTDSPGRDAHPSFSRDGKGIAFQRLEAAARLDLCNERGRIRPTATYRLTGFAGVPDWSPGDQEIIFQANMNPTLDPAYWQIFLMKADGSRLRQITHDGYDDQVPKWSPDGSRILFFSNKTGRNQLYTMRPDGSDWQPVTISSRNDHAASWSHDGYRILFAADAGSGMNIYTLELRTQKLRQLTTNAPGMGVPYWSPDEKSIVFTLHRGDDSDIYFMDGDGLHQRKASLAEVPH